MRSSTTKRLCVYVTVFCFYNIYVRYSLPPSRDGCKRRNIIFQSLQVRLWNPFANDGYSVLLSATSTTRCAPTPELLNSDLPPCSSRSLYKCWGIRAYAKSYASEMIFMCLQCNVHATWRDTLKWFIQRMESLSLHEHNKLSVSFRKVFKLREPPKVFTTTIR